MMLSVKFMISLIPSILYEIVTTLISIAQTRKVRLLLLV